MSRRALALCLALLLPISAAAQTVDADHAQQLQDDLRGWFTGMFGANPAGAAQRLQVTAEDNHFRVALPLVGANRMDAIRADVRPLPDGTWSVDALRLPDAARFTVQMPQPGQPPGTTVPTRFDLRIGGQNMHGLIDPALAVPSRLDVDLTNVDLLGESARQHQEQHIDRYTVQATLQPHDGRLDLVEQGTITGLRSASREGDKPAVGFGADRIQASGRIDGIDRTHATAMLAAASGLFAALPPAAAVGHGGTALSPPARAALRAFIESLRGIVTGIRVEETIDGLHIAIANRGEATVRQVSLGMAGTAPGGLLHATLTIALDGLAVQNLPPTALALMPHHVVLRPTVSGVSLAALTQLALAATEPHLDHARLQADAAALLTQGGVTAGLDAMDLDIGPAQLHGRGDVLVTGPADYEAHAHITATGLDALMRQAATNPALQRALPLLAMARGFARPEGDRLVWDIVAGHTGVMVNGVPLGGAPGEGHPRENRQPDDRQPDNR